jgi:Acetyltransferase (GNAT) domain
LTLEGYFNPLYACSLDEFGSPILLRHSQGWLLEREVPGTKLHDLMGCYPLFSCLDWQALAEDIKEVPDRYVSLVLVTDPFQDLEEAKLQEIFPDTARPFKQHFIVDLGQDPWKSVSKHHRRYLRKAEKDVRVEISAEPTAWVGVWVNLYQNIIVKYQLRGIQAFSESSFTRLMQMQGVELILAYRRGEPVGAQIWIRQDNRVYNHLNALSKIGYQVGAGFALYGFAIDYFKNKVQYLDLGGGAGFSVGGTDGLSAFKRGWTNKTRLTFLCGKVFDKQKYNELVQLRNFPLSGYFPAYRWGEFALESVKM